jgi:hypothetical protein
MVIPLCQMISMSVVHLALKIDIFKMKHAFQISYQERDKFFYVSLFNRKGEEEFQKQHMFSWSQYWMSENERFDSFLFVDLNFKSLSKHMFLCGMGTTSCRLGYLTLTVCTMMSPHDTFLLIPLSLTPLMGLLNSSLP